MPTSTDSDVMDSRTTPTSDLPTRVASAIAVSITKVEPSARVTAFVPSRGRDNDIAWDRGSWMNPVNPVSMIASNSTPGG